MKHESICDLSDSRSIDPREEGSLGEAHLMREKVQELLAEGDDEDEESRERGKQEVHDLIRERVTLTTSRRRSPLAMRAPKRRTKRPSGTDATDRNRRASDRIRSGGREEGELSADRDDTAVTGCNRRHSEQSAPRISVFTHRHTEGLEARYTVWGLCGCNGSRTPSHDAPRKQSR